jgi:hypothetical protein
MDQEPASGGGGKPGIFQKLNGVIAGITGLVVALGGLAAATKGVMWDKEPVKEQRVAEQPPQPASAPQEQAAVEKEATLYKGDLYEDGAFNGGIVLLEKKGDSWTLTAGDDSYAYDELATGDKSHVFAVSGSSTLRWPVKGGVVEESTRDERDEWKTYAKVEAAEPK